MRKNKKSQKKYTEVDEIRYVEDGKVINTPVDEKEEEYSLYTEKIVINPFVKYKKIFAVVKLLLAAVVFGVVASFVMSWVYPRLQKKYADDNTITRPTIVLDKDAYPVEVQSGEESIVATQTETVKSKLTMTEIIEKAKKSVIGVDRDYTSPDSAISATVSPTQTVGLVVGDTGESYIAITNDTVVKGLSECVITVGESTECYADVVGVHDDFELAVLSIKKRNVPDIAKKDLAIAVLDNSYLLKQGDAVITYGKLNGKIDTSSHSYITGISYNSLIDGGFDVIETTVPANVGDYSFLFNELGNVVGISRALSKDSNMKVAGISDMKAMIEMLSAGSQIVYMGIEATTINNAIAVKYGFPQGIYVNDVVMDSPAYYAGLQAGDIITGFNGISILTIRAFNEKLYKCASGQSVSIDIKRLGNDQYRSLNYVVTLSNK